jgi:hypothetical protein
MELGSKGHDGSPRAFATLRLSGCYHGPWAGRKTQDPSGRGGVMYHLRLPKHKSLQIPLAEGGKRDGREPSVCGRGCAQCGNKSLHAVLFARYLYVNMTYITDL